MAVLPKIDRAPKHLQSRVATVDSLSGGAIAGIVIGIIIGLLLFLAATTYILWRRRRRASREPPSPNFIPGELADTQIREEPDNGSLRASRITDIHLSGSKKASAPTIPPALSDQHIKPDPVPGSHIVLRGSSWRRVSELAVSPYTTSSVDGKPIEVDAKRILGIDDASYLDGLPSYASGESCMTVAPACVASNSRPQLSSTEGSSVNLQSSQGSAVSYHNGRKCRVLPISELGSAYAPAELYCPPPDDRDTPDCFTVGRRKRTRAVAKRATDRKITETTTNQSKGGDTAVCVNPWDVEYQPNPVIFSHLASSVKAQAERNMEGSTIAAPSLTRSFTSGNHLATFPQNLNSFEDRPTLRVPSRTVGLGTLMKRQSIDAESSDDTIPTMESSISELSTDDISLVTTLEWYCGGDAKQRATHNFRIPYEPIQSDPLEKREISSTQELTTLEGISLCKGKERCLDNVETVELINFAATISSSSNCENNTAIVMSSTSCTWTQGDVFPSASQASSPNVPSPANVLVSPSVSTDTSTDTAFPCPLCHLSFRTPGSRRNHQNRKHNLRYPCRLCSSRFGLRADLQRHEDNVHRYDTQISPKKLFRCPNTDCTAPGKTYARKDNFKRHVQRCKKAMATAIQREVEVGRV